MADTYTKRQFVADFELVAEHYKLRELGQYEEAKQAARDDMENARVCFKHMAEWLRSHV